MRLLLIDDDPVLNLHLGRTFEAEKYRCDIATTLAEARHLIDERHYSIMLLDLHLPDGNGMHLLRDLRSEGHTLQVIILSADNAVGDRVKALDAGADDYLGKPFAVTELLARMRALGRREAAQKMSRITAGALTLDMKTREVYVSGRSCELTTREFELLELLVINKNRVMTRYQIMDYLCDCVTCPSNSNVVDVHVKNLRRKLGLRNLIRAVRGVGYTIKA